MIGNKLFKQQTKTNSYLPLTFNLFQYASFQNQRKSVLLLHLCVNQAGLFQYYVYELSRLYLIIKNTWQNTITIVGHCLT